MAISHVFSSPLNDITGTVTVFNSAGQTTTGIATQIVRPSDWNSVHKHYVTLSGNVVGDSTLSGTNIVYQGGDNITLSGTGQTIIFSGASGGTGGGGGATNVTAYALSNTTLSTS